MPLGYRLLALALIIGSVVPITQANAQSDALDLSLTEIASGLERPVAIAVIGDGSNRLFVVEQAGTIAIVENGEVSDTK